MTDNWWIMGQIAEARIGDLRRAAAPTYAGPGSNPRRRRGERPALLRRLHGQLVSLGRTFTT